MFRKRLPACLAVVLLCLGAIPVLAHNTGCGHTHGSFLCAVGSRTYKVPTVTCTAVGAACRTPTVNPGVCAQVTVSDVWGTRNTDCPCWPQGAQDVDKEQDCGSVHAVATQPVSIPGTVTLKVQEGSETGLPQIRATLNHDEIGEFTEASGTFVLKFGENNLDASQIPVVIEGLTIDTPSLIVNGEPTGPHHSVLDRRYPAVAEYNANTMELNTVGSIRVLQTNDKFSEERPMEGYGVATATLDTETGDMIFNFCVETPIPRAQPAETSPKKARRPGE